MIVLDASVLIAHLDADDAHHDRATQLLIAAADQPLGGSPLTMAEVLVGPARAGKLEQAQLALGQLGIVTVGLTEDSPAALAQLRVAHAGLRLSDCCVLHAALVASATVATLDDRLGRAAAELGLIAGSPPI